MLKKKLSPIIGKFAGAWSSGNCSGISDPATSPRSPFHFDTQSPSPRSPKNYHLGGIGLGIVVERKKSGEIILSGQNLNLPNPASDNEEIEEDDMEDYTYVTCHGPNKSYTRVYCDENRRGLVGRKNDKRSIFYIASPTYEDVAQFPPLDFLSLCHLCNKKLHGKDVYMYRGEKGFCSNECRYEHIMMDQRDKKY